jgi:protein-tyrosine phosphatase
MTSFVDTHCHGIPGVDDGVQSDDAALLMLRHAVESQIRLVFMTPHVIKDGRFYPDKALLNKKLKALQKQIKDNNLDIQVKLGCEIMITPESLKMIQEKDYWGYQDTDYVLIEFMPPFEENLIQDALYELKRQNKRVLVAHPERYFSTPKEAIQRVKGWIQAGAFMQVNKSSLFVSKKASNRKNALALIENNLVSIIATDAHHAPGKRECRLMAAYMELRRLYGTETAERLCSINPTLLSENKACEKTSVRNDLLNRLIHAVRSQKLPQP